eukprot:220052_1
MISLFLLLLLWLFIECQSVTCDIENEVLHNYDLNNLINNGWSRCYLKSYASTLNIDTLITSCQTGTDYYLFVGALTSSTSTTAHIAAMGPSHVLTGYTSTGYTAYKPVPFSNENPSYNVYWYNYPSKSFGFSPDSYIRIKSTNFISGYGCVRAPCDCWDPSRTSGNGQDPYRYADGRDCLAGYDRLSWITNQVAGGRAGSFWGRSTSWYKVVYYKYCPPTSSPTVRPTNQPTNKPTVDPTMAPTNAPTFAPTFRPTASTEDPTFSPTSSPTEPPTGSPTLAPILTPTFAPTYSPTDAPTHVPTVAPSSSPTYSPYKMIEIDGLFMCSDLSSSYNIIYGISFSNCVYEECWTDDQCLVVNYISNIKKTSDSRCYVFNKQCNMESVDDIGSKIAIRGYQSFCTDFPSDWTDKFVDVCYHYESLEWCLNNTINTQHVSVDDIISNRDSNYGYNANEACCACGGGAELIELGDGNTLLSFESSVTNIVPPFSSNNLLCNWKLRASYWRTYSNLDLYDLCIKLKHRVFQNYIFLQDKNLFNNHFNDIQCDVVIDKLHQKESDIILCDFAHFYDNNNGLYYLLIYEVPSNESFGNIEIYLNAQWFNISESLLSDHVSIHHLSYEQCQLKINFSSYENYYYGIFPCDVDTFTPTSYPTFYPTFYATFYPTVDATVAVTDATMDNAKVSVFAKYETVIWIVIISVLVCGCGCLLLGCLFAGKMKYFQYKSVGRTHEHSDSEESIEMQKREVLNTISNRQIKHNPIPSAPSEMDGEFQIGLCIVCCQKKAKMFNDPCGHITYCCKCANKTLQQNRKMRCPTCRKEIECKEMYNAGFDNN